MTAGDTSSKDNDGNKNEENKNEEHKMEKKWFESVSENIKKPIAQIANKEHCTCFVPADHFELSFLSNLLSGKNNIVLSSLVKE